MILLFMYNFQLEFFGHVLTDINSIHNGAQRVCFIFDSRVKLQSYMLKGWKEMELSALHVAQLPPVEFSAKNKTISFSNCNSQLKAERLDIKLNAFIYS